MVQNAFTYTLSSRGIFRLTRLRLINVEPATTVGLFCYGRGCPFGARMFFSRRGGTVRAHRHVRGLRIRTPMRFEVVLYNANFTGAVFRLRAERGGTPKYSRLCLPPAAPAPVGCAA